MAILLREYLGSPAGEESTCTQINLTEASNVLSTVSRDSIMVDIEGIHVGPTRNFTWYTKEALIGSIPSWTKPYERPLILHHNETDGKIIGRILAAHYNDANTRSGTGALLFTCNVSDEDGKKGVKDGRLKTTSIGVIAHDVRCSICGHVISEYGECEHERGVSYNGEICYWMVYKMEAKELSYVIVPSDIYAHNIRVYSPDQKNLTENTTKKGVSKVEDLKENVNVEETVIVEDADKKDTKVNETAPTKKTEEVIKSETVEELKELIAKLNEKIEELNTQLKEQEDKTNEALKLKEAAENELITANAQLKEFAVEQIIMFREQLGRPALLKENLMNRSHESLMDSIIDLKEEMNITNPVGKIEIKESTEHTNDEKSEDLSKIEVALTESLIDEDKDTSAKKDDKVEKKSVLDVKEKMESGNKDYESAFAEMTKFYNL